ncbi:hypothetical protein HKI87_08g55530 [Chloropicon roscoffensis]|uniref:Uncharacterized protein n=1 Tax=Chloropicon roscoffensis TaxID=1461544 RepID=A0AAX4PDI0_9CHLO
MVDPPLEGRDWCLGARVLVADDAGAECVSVGSPGRPGGLSSSQLCALLSSFCGFEEKHGTRTMATWPAREGGCRLELGRRNPRTGLRAFVVQPWTPALAPKEVGGLLRLSEKVVDAIGTPWAVAERAAGGRRSSAIAARHPAAAELGPALRAAVERTASAAEEEEEGGEDPPKTRAETMLRQIESQVSREAAYCATAWVQRRGRPLAWTDESALVPEVEGAAGDELGLTAKACAVIATAAMEGGGGGEGGGLGYWCRRVYLGDDFLDSGQDPEAALCSLHVFRPCGKHFNGGGLALAMICEGTASLDRAKDFAIFASVRAGLAELSPPPR